VSRSPLHSRRIALWQTANRAPDIRRADEIVGLARTDTDRFDRAGWHLLKSAGTLYDPTTAQFVSASGKRTLYPSNLKPEWIVHDAPILASQ
jgi:hypothetical protein